MRTAALALGLTLAAGPAAADWENTRWGMSPAEAGQAVMGRALSADEVKTYEGGGYAPRMTFDYLSLDGPFTGLLYFDRDARLAMVVLHLANPAKDWRKVLAAMQERHGRPKSRWDDSSAMVVSWRTDEDDIDFVVSPTQPPDVRAWAQFAKKGYLNPPR